jgi:hypothetical protein
MTVSVVKSFAEKTGKTVASVEKLWDEIVVSTKKAHPTLDTKGNRFFEIVTGSLKKALQIDEANFDDEDADYFERLGSELSSLAKDREDLEEEATVSGDIAVVPKKLLQTPQKRKKEMNEENQTYQGLPLFEVSAEDFMNVSKIRHGNSRPNITDEKVNEFLRENKGSYYIKNGDGIIFIR